MALWPLQFPRTQRIGYVGSAEMPMRDTQFPSSTKRRKTFDDPWTIIKLKMFMDATQFSYFNSWLRYKAKDGSEIIQRMPLLDATMVITLMDGFIQPGSINWEFRETSYLVSFDFRIPNLTIPAESSLDIYTGTIRIGVKALTLTPRGITRVP